MALALSKTLSHDMGRSHPQQWAHSAKTSFLPGVPSSCKEGTLAFQLYTLMPSVPCSHLRPLAFAVLPGMFFGEIVAWLASSLFYAYIQMSPPQSGLSWPPSKTPL